MSVSFERHMKCPVARAAKILEGRWTALILREFFLKGPRKNDGKMMGDKATATGGRL